MNIRVPYYYKDFKCIADKCTDTCCAGWDVDVDKKSADYYKSVTGEFGDRIKSVMVMHEDGEAHFTLKDNGWCPFLNDRLLCDLYTELGEEHLCDTCAYFPRFIEEYGATREIGLAFSCITAGELMLKDDTPVTFENTEDGKPVSAYNDIDPQLYFFLQGSRKKSYDVARNRNKSINDRYSECLFYADELQKCIKKKKYTELMPVSCEAVKAEKGIKRKTLSEYWNIFDKLEVINKNWDVCVSDVKRYLYENADDDCYYAYYEEFDRYYADRQYEYEHFLMYCLYRYFLKAVNDRDVLSKVKIAVVGFLMIKELDVARFVRNGKTLSKEEQVDIMHLYSREVEHSYENFEMLTGIFAKDKAFETKKLLMILND